jgi:hypothetical protein
MVPAEALSATSRDIAECAKIKNDTERLKCYDNLAAPILKETQVRPDAAEQSQFP